MKSVAATASGAYARFVAARALDLFSAYRSGDVTPAGGYVVSSFMVDGSAYVRYEIVAYRSLRRLGLSDDGLAFAADGNKVYVLVEPVGFPGSSTEPWQRDAAHRIPHTFRELSIVAARNHSRIMVSGAPVPAPAAFTVGCPHGTDFAFLFPPRRDALDTVGTFMALTLQEECLVPATAAQRAAALIRARLETCAAGTSPW